jgi:predicted RNase H-like nuclease
MQYSKKKLLGRKERMELLFGIYPDLDRIIAKTRAPKEVAPDDILDALVADWTAVQILKGKAGTLPQIPELDRKDLKMEIVYPAR